MSKLLFVTLLLVMVSTLTLSSVTWNPNEITGYHFHTYFFQNNDQSVSEALTLRGHIQSEINAGTLKGCRLNYVNYGPRGPHPIGSYETCCNASALSHTTSWFMQNRFNLSILFHPLTRWEIIDHTERAMWLGKSAPLDLSVLEDDLGEHPKCLPLPIHKD